MTSFSERNTARSPCDIDDELLQIQFDESIGLVARTFDRLCSTLSDEFGSDMRGSVDPVILFRQAQPAFAAAETSGLDDDILLPLLLAYTFLVIGPAQILDAHIDGIEFPDVNEGAVATTTSALRWPLCSLMTARGYELFAESLPPLCSGLIFPLIRHMYQCMYQQRKLSRPFNRGRLHNPGIVFAEYRSAYSPEDASIFNRSLWFGGLAIAGWEANRIERTRPLATRLSRQRQRIDELADMYEDMLAGYVTKPWAVAIDRADRGAREEITELVEDAFWSVRSKEAEAILSIKSRDTFIEWLSSRPFVTEARDILWRQGVLEEITVMLLEENREIEMSIAETLQPLPRERLTRINQLKRALIQRLEFRKWLPHLAPDDVVKRIRNAVQSCE